jgi:CheY-like chemotaxis protein
MISKKEQFKEKRELIRFLFSSTDRVFGGFGLPESSEEIVSLRILECSAGGLQYTIARDKEKKVGVGSIITLHYVKGHPALEFVSRITLKVRWISDNPVFADIVVGCQFLDISKTIKQKIIQLTGVQEEAQEVIFCEECGTKKIIDREAMADIDKHPLICQACNYMISRETIIAYSSNVNTRDRSLLHVLLIDDDLGNLLTLTAMLKKKYIVTMAPTGKRGLELAERTVPDLILLDVVMPEMGGFEVCTRLKANEKTSNIPVIFITAKSLEDDEYLFVGAAEYITKPVNRQVLDAKIRIHIQFKLLQDAHDKQIVELEHVLASLKKKYLESDVELEAIRQEKRNLEIILDTIDVIVIIQTNEQKIVWANRNALNIFKTTLADVIGKPCHTLLQNSGVACVDCPLSAGGNNDYSKPIEVYNDRVNRLFSQFHLPLFNDDGELTGAVHLIKMKTSAKSEAGNDTEQEPLSPLDISLSDNLMELNDIISTILIGSDTVRNKYKDDASLEDVSEYIGEAANRLRVMLKDFKTLPYSL